MTAAAIVKAYNLISYDAVAVGSQDLIAGVPYLKSLSKGAKFPWLSANLVNKATKKTLFTASTSIKLGSIKAGIIGLTGPAILEASENAVILPWDQVLPALVAKMTKKNNLLILLSNLPAVDNKQIAESYPDIHLIIQSGASSNTISAAPINNTIMLSTAPQGKQIGVMEINWQSSRRWEDPNAVALAAKKASLERLDAQLQQYKKRPETEERLNSQPELLKVYNLILAQKQNLQGEIDLLETKTKQHIPPGSKLSTYNNRFIAMAIDLPDHPEVSRVVASLDTAINAIGQRRAEAVTTPKSSPYLGFLGCATCHARQFTSWQQTRHAKAYLTLAKKKQQFNPNCLPCHVTGIAPDRGEEALSIPDERRSVGCETCHGPGHNHSENPKAYPLARRPSPEQCRQCHIPPHDNNFDYDKQIKLIEHH